MGKQEMLVKGFWFNAFAIDFRQQAYDVRLSFRDSFRLRCPWGNRTLAGHVRQNTNRCLDIGQFSDRCIQCLLGLLDARTGLRKALLQHVQDIVHGRYIAYRSVRQKPFLYVFPKFWDFLEKFWIRRAYTLVLGARGAEPLASIPSYFFNSAELTPPQSPQRRTYRYPPQPALPHSPPTSRCGACRSSTIPYSSHPSSPPSSIPSRGFRRSWRVRRR